MSGSDLLVTLAFIGVISAATLSSEFARALKRCAWAVIDFLFQIAVYLGVSILDGWEVAGIVVDGIRARRRKHHKS